MAKANPIHLHKTKTQCDGVDVTQCGLCYWREGDTILVTTDPAKVTCGNCLRIIKAREKQK